MHQTDPKDKAIVLKSLGLISISGGDAKKFLQGQLTCDLEEVTENEVRLGAQCNPAGRIIHFFRIYWFQNQYLLQMQRSMIPIAINALKKYAIFFKVTLIDASDQFKQIGYLGKLGNAGIPIDHSASRFILFNENHFDLNEETTEEVWYTQEINAGIPTIYPETSEKFLPHELNLPALNAVSFKKGCFTGQEIIARMEYKAKLKKRMFLAQAESVITPTRGGEIYCENKPAGNIVDFCQVGYNKWKLLVIASIEQVSKQSFSLDASHKQILTFE